MKTKLLSIALCTLVLATMIPIADADMITSRHTKGAVQPKEARVGLAVIVFIIGLIRNLSTNGDITFEPILVFRSDYGIVFTCEFPMSISNFTGILTRHFICGIYHYEQHGW